jgi:hypothetical protein
MLINSKPLLYLGRDKVSGSYYFLSSKEGEGRFLKYVTYPFWCLASSIGNLLDLTAELPAEVMQDVINFVNGTVRYEIVPRKQGRAERVVKHQIESVQGERRTGAESTDQGEKGPSVGNGQIGTPRGGNEASDITPKRGRGRPKQIHAADSGGVEEATGGEKSSGVVENGTTEKSTWPFHPSHSSPFASQKGTQAQSNPSVVCGQADSNGNAGEKPALSEQIQKRRSRSSSTISQDGALLAGSGESGRLPSPTGGECDGSGRGSATGGNVLEQPDQRGGCGVTETSVVTPVKRGRGRPRKNPLNNT